MTPALIALLLVQSDPNCGPRAGVERELRESGYASRVTGQDAAGNVVSWHENDRHQWVILVAPHTRPDALCIVATGGPREGAGK